MVRLKKAVLASEVDGEKVLLDAETGVYFGLNETGSRILDFLIEEGVEEAALTRFLEEFDAPPERTREDFLLFVSRLREKKLILDEAE